MNTAKTRSNGSASERLMEHSATVAEDVRELGRLTTDAAREKLGEAKEMAGTKLREGRSYLESSMQESPIRSLAIAVGVGAMLGYLWAKKS
jgi:ElaB/YqjD/DUF883 family membrane-anchored ribosome-binding protein